MNVQVLYEIVLIVWVWVVFCFDLTVEGVFYVVGQIFFNINLYI